MTSPDCRPNRRHFLQSATAGFAGLSWSIRELAGGRQWTAIQKLIDGYVADKKMAGAGVAISYGGAPVTYLAAGTIAFDSQTRFDESSICRIHSLTKPVTGIAAMLHVAYRERGITPGNFGERLNRQGYGPQATSLVDMVRRLAELPLAYEPGTVSNYSIGTDVIALVIERASGMPYERFLRDRLFARLDMPSTGFQVRREDAGRLTTLYQFAPPGLTPTDAAATSAFLEPPQPATTGNLHVIAANP
jgi:CubicO group peptidase (beta-lactamase class C family)